MVLFSCRDEFESGPFRKKDNGLNSKNPSSWPPLHGTESRNVASVVFRGVIMKEITSKNVVFVPSLSFCLFIGKSRQQSNER